MDGGNPEIGGNVVAAGRATNYLEAGSGEPVVLIHGSGPGVTAYANWRLTVPALAEHFRVVAPDIAGFGYTEASVDETFDYDVWIGHVVGFMDALGIRSAHVLGNSFGGALAIQMAIRHPERVRRLVLMGAVGAAFELTEGLDAVWGYQPGEDNMRRMIRYFAYDLSLISDELVRSRYQASLRPGIQEMYAGMFPAPRQRHIDRFAAPEDRVRAIDKETMIFHGRDDQVIPVQVAIRLNQLIPRSQLHVFGRCGHWTQVEHAARFNRMVTEFLLEDS